MKSGIYLIANTKSGRIYVGQTLNLGTMLQVLLRALSLGGHGNARLQADYNVLGPGYFDFTVLERAAPPQLAEREQHWIEESKSRDPQFGYN